jgi:hypothetical protein
LAALLHREHLEEDMALEKGLWDRLVNSKWPNDTTIPTEQEAISGAKRLYRKAMSQPWRGSVKITSGNRYTRIRGRVLFVNPNQKDGTERGSWEKIVHSISHYAHRRLNPNDAPHSSRQAYIERDLTDYVLTQGWLDGKLKRHEKPKEDKDVVSIRYQRILAREASWEKKLNRAKNALVKVRKESRAYQNRHGERVVA